MCGWFCVSAGTVKRRTSAVTKSWDDQTPDDLLICMVTETIARAKKNDPARRYWCIRGEEMNTWLNAMIGVLLEKGGTAIEDTC